MSLLPSTRVRNRSTGCRLLAGLLALSLLGSAVRAADKDAVGQRVVVLHDATPIKAGDKVIDVVNRGRVLSVIDSNSGWLLVSRGHPGWLDAAQVLPVAAAIEYFNQAVAKSPGDAGARAARAAVWAEQQNWGAASAEAGEAVRENPQLLEAWLARSAAELGQSAYDAAWADAQKAAALAPTLPDGCLAAAEVLVRQGSFLEALAQYTAALERDRANSRIKLHRAEIRLKLSSSNQWDLAAEELRETIELAEHDPNCRHAARLARGNACILQGNVQRAEVEFSSLLAVDPADVKALIGRGRALGYDRRYDIAMRALGEAIYIEPKNPRTHLARAEIRNYQYNLRGAMHDVDEALRLDPRCADGYRIRAELLIKQKKWGQALEALAQAIQLEPKNAANYVIRARAHQGKRDTASVQADWLRAEELEPHVLSASRKGPAVPTGSTAADRFEGLLLR